MRVSILIPTQNRLDYLRRSLHSARMQRHTNLEILVSDDGSTDGSREYVSAVGKIDPRIRLLTTNAVPGMFSNINFLVSNSSGDAFSILCDDDQIDPNFVERLVEPMLKLDSVIVTFSDHRLIDSAGDYLPEASDELSRYYGRAILPSGIVRDPEGVAISRSLCLGFALFRSSVFRGELFDLACGTAADWDYAFRAASLGDLFYIADRLGDIRSHPGSATQMQRLYTLRCGVQILHKYRLTNPEHQARQRQLLTETRAVSRAFAFPASVSNRREAIGYLRLYFQVGGSVFDFRILGTIVLVLLPRAMARKVRKALLRAPARRVLRQWGSPCASGPLSRSHVESTQVISSPLGLMLSATLGATVALLMLLVTRSSAVGHLWLLWLRTTGGRN